MMNKMKFVGCLSATAVGLVVAQSSWAAQMYANKFAGVQTVPENSYGDIVVEKGGIKAMAFTTATSAAGGDGDFARIIQSIDNSTQVRTHTVSGWFKVGALPEGDAKKVIYYARSNNDGHGGYRVAVGSDGKIYVGKANGNGDAGNDQNLLSVSTDAVITPNTWMYLTFAVTNVDAATKRAEVALYVNGVAKEMSGQFATNLNGNTCNGLFVGADISVAGLYVDTEAISDVSAMKAWAVDSSYVRYVNSVIKATMNDSLAFSAIAWEGGRAPDAGETAEITLNGDVTLTVDQAIAADEVKILGADKALTLAGGSLDAATLAKFNFTEFTGKVVFPETCDLVPSAAAHAAYAYRFEKDYSAGFTLNQGAGSYEFKNAKIETQCGADYKVVVRDGDTLHLADRSGQADGRTSLSLDVQGGTVTIGKADGNGSFWYGTGGATTYNQTAGTVTCTANGAGTSTSGNGLLLGWSGGLASMTISGGIFDVSNSSLNFWSTSTTLAVSGGTVKAKGVFKGDANSNGHQIVLSDTGTFELGSIGWTGVGLTLNGGTLKAYESTTMAADITLDDAATVEVPATVELKLTGSVTGTGVITKTGEGVLNVGTVRPTMDVQSGSVKIVATPAEIAAGNLVLPIPEDAAEGSLDKVSVVTAEGNTIEINGDPIVDAENHTITINLVTIPPITETTAISSLNLSDDKTGTLVVQGAATAETAYTVTFDVALPDGVNVTVNGHVAFAGANVPYNKLTIEDGTNLTLPTFTGTVASGIIITTASATGTITNNGTFNVTGDSTFTLTNNGTLNLVSGTSTISSDFQAIKGAINIAYGAVYKCNSNDQVPYGGSVTTTINVRGTLDMQNHRWTLGGADTINLYGGCTVLGQGDDAGLFDLYREGNIINVYAGEGEQAAETTVTLPAPIRARNANGNIFIAQNMKLALAGGIKDADIDNAVINMNGAGRLTGSIALKPEREGGFTLNLGASVGTIDAKFVAEKGDATLKLGQSAGSVQITTTDSKDEPFITVNSGATLQLYVKDLSSWNQAVTEYGWIKSSGTLNVRELNAGQTRYMRTHFLLDPGTTTTFYGTNQNMIVYGGNSDKAKAQFVVPAPLPEGATKATVTGEAKIQLNVNGSDGTPGAAADVAKGAELEIANEIIGSESLAKYGLGQLSLTGKMTGYTGTVILREGTLFVPTGSALVANRITTGVPGMMLKAKTIDGGTLYKLSLKAFTFIIK